MKQYFKVDEWCIIEEGFDPKENRVAESIFSLGNGHMGQRANFEEGYSGDSLQGSYMAGVYYPDKTRVGWWKNGYPEYFAKVLNSTNWIGIDIVINGETLDLAKAQVKNFTRVLNMKEAYLERSFTAVLSNGNEIKVNAKRFLSAVYTEVGAIRYSITPLNFSGELKITPYLDGDIKNEDSNYDEKFWDKVQVSASTNISSIVMKTKKLDFHICSAMKFDIVKGGAWTDALIETITKENFVSNTVTIHAAQDEDIIIYKYAANVTSRDYSKEELVVKAAEVLTKAYSEGFDKLLDAHIKAWDLKWKESDIVIEGDVEAQQGIRFNIFQLNQTYSGEDERLNIGPKGFTGEKYGGSTYWDTEAYCIPFYLSTAEEKVARNLLVYRYKQLEKAKENARKLGYKKGALYPMVTMNGEECHNEWEITFEEIHRNGAIAYAIYNYVNYTGDKSYLGECGLNVLAEISRFWEERVHYAPRKGKYMMHGVTGPNEYENNVNNNWYTNRIAAWTLEYTLEVIDYLKVNEPYKYKELEDELQIKAEETVKWKDILDNMFYPVDEELGIFLQQEGYMDKEQILVSELTDADRPINQKWSWDRILRSCFIKQADVLQGLFFLEHLYDEETIRRNFNFYEPRTVHESSLSPCVHSILASKLGMQDKAYEMYLRTSRLDLDNYNNDTEDGCHTTSMAGTWMSVVQGFGGMRIKEDKLYFNPFIPGHWNSFSFKVMFRGALLKVTVNKNCVILNNESAIDLTVVVKDKEYEIRANEELTINN
jgi:maltose phosphorylase